VEINANQLNKEFALLFFRYNKREKKQEADILKQADTMPAPQLTADKPLPAAKSLQTRAAVVPPEDQHQFDNPDNTAGQANTKRRRTGVTRQLFPASSAVPSSGELPSTSALPRLCPFPTMPGGYTIQLVDPQGVPIQAPYSVTPSTSVAKSTDWYRQKKGGQTKRYNMKKDFKSCSRCGDKLDTTTGHKQYYGKWFCPKTDTMSVEEWMAQRKEEMKKTKTG
jgi:hypothetical protein